VESKDPEEFQVADAVWIFSTNDLANSPHLHRQKDSNCKGNAKIFGVLRLRSSQTARATSLRMTILWVTERIKVQAWLRNNGKDNG
jgi:hypothetical protein